MWTKTLTVKFQKRLVPVMVWLSDTKEDNEQIVTMQSMLNEYFLIEQIQFADRDAAYDFIKHCSVSLAQSFLIRKAYSEGALQ